jgi:hypothetical protein
MSKQSNKVQKRVRRERYIKRKKQAANKKKPAAAAA